MLCTCVVKAITCRISLHVSSPWCTRRARAPCTHHVYTYTYIHHAFTRMCMLTILCEMHCEMHLAHAGAVQAAFLDETVVPRRRLVGVINR